MYKNNSNNSNNNNNNKNNIISLLGTKPQDDAIRWMTMANALHFASYECSRIATMALLTSPKNGFQSASSVSFATAVVSPFSVLLLWKYSCVFDQYGPRKTLLFSTIFFAIIVMVTGIILILLDPLLLEINYQGGSSTDDNNNQKNQRWFHILSQIILFALYVCKNSFVQLFYAQHWSFITSVYNHDHNKDSNDHHQNHDNNTKNPTNSNHHHHQQTTTTNGKENSDTSKNHVTKNSDDPKILTNDTTTTPTTMVDDHGASTWFPIISGIGSVSATISAYGLSHPDMLRIFHITLPKLIIIASILMLFCSHCSNRAYQIAEQYDFVPSSRTKQHDHQPKKNSDDINKNEQQQQYTSSFIQRTIHILKRVPILQGLCIEVLICQAVSSIMSYLFISTTKKQLVTNDQERARYTGKVYASINFGSGMMEFLILPLTLKYINKNKNLWLFMPTTMFLLILWIVQSSTLRDLNHFAVTISFVMMKIIEYSVRGNLTEMVYVTLDYESRFFGKDVVGLVANRFGKSAAAIALSLVALKLDTAYFDTQVAPYTLLFLTCLWLMSSNNIITLLSLNKSKVD